MDTYSKYENQNIISQHLFYLIWPTYAFSAVSYRKNTFYQENDICYDKTIITSFNKSKIKLKNNHMLWYRKKRGLTSVCDLLVFLWYTDLVLWRAWTAGCEEKIAGLYWRWFPCTEKLNKFCYNVISVISMKHLLFFVSIKVSIVVCKVLW